MKKQHASFHENIIFQDMLGVGERAANIVSIGKDGAYISVIFLHFKELFPV